VTKVYKYHKIQMLIRWCLSLACTLPDHRAEFKWLSNLEMRQPPPGHLHKCLVCRTYKTCSLRFKQQANCPICNTYQDQLWFCLVCAWQAVTDCVNIIHVTSTDDTNATAVHHMVLTSCCCISKYKH